MDNKQYNYKHETDSDSVTKIEVKIDKNLFNKEKTKTLQVLAKDVDLKGFRPGKAPQNVIETKLGPKLYEETLNNILPQVTYEIITELEMEPISRVDYKVTKYEPETGLEFEASFTAFPEIKIGNLKKIKVEKEETKITSEDIQKVIDNMFKDYQEKNEKQKDKISKPNDEWVKKLGMENINNLEELKEQIKLTLENQRKVLNQEKYTKQILEKAIELSNIKAPKQLVDAELDLREKDYSKRIEDLGLKIEDFLKSQNTTMEKLKKDWREETENKIKIELLLIQAIKDNKFKVSEEEVEKELDKIKDQNLKKEYSTKQGKQKIQSTILKQKALNWIINQSEEKK
ncbi:hypothetical protein GF362_06605 [Candidatus Dojkabacteria bacterium]|nr:hypothetical protein [Candidatus Dojkabacteria bacterium]